MHRVIPYFPNQDQPTEQTLEDFLEGAMPKKVMKPIGPVLKNNHRYLTGVTHARPIMGEFSIHIRENRMHLWPKKRL